MSSVSQGQEPQLSASNLNASGESRPPLTSEQVRAGTTVLMTHSERQEFWRTSRIGKLLGFDRWPAKPEENVEPQEKK